MTAKLPEEVKALVEDLLACPAEELANWITLHRTLLSMKLLEALKQYADAANATSDPERADSASRRALTIAEMLPHEPLAMPLACWARGNWAMFHAPYESIVLYEQAVAGYDAVGDTLKVARLKANLVYVLAESLRFHEAQTAYNEALPVLLSHPDTEPRFLLALEQNYGVCLYTQGRYEEALCAYERAFEIAQRHHFSVSMMEALVNRTLALGMLGRIAEAETAFLRGRSEAEKENQTLTVTRIDMNLGELYTFQGRPALALRQFQTAREAFTAHNNRMELGSVLMREAVLFQHIGALQEALWSYIQAQTEFEQQQMWTQVGQVLIHLAVLRRLLGDFVQASTLLDEAEALGRQHQQSSWLTVVLLERIALAIDQEDAATALTLVETAPPAPDNVGLNAQRNILEAEALRKFDEQAEAFEKSSQIYEQVLSYGEFQGNRWLQRQALAGLGQLWLAKDPEKARAYLENAVGYDDQTRQALSVEELKASFQVQSSDLLPILIRLAITQEQFWQALKYIWRFKVSGFIELIQEITDEQSLSSDEQSEFDRVRQELAVRRWILAREANADLPDNLRESNDETIQRLEQQLCDLRRRRNRQLLSQDIDLFGDPARLVAQMDADVLLEYMRCGDEILGVLADKSRICRAVWLTDTETLQDLSDELQLNFLNVLTQTPERRVQFAQQWRSECLPQLQRSYDLLIAPFRDTVAGRRLLVAPCAPLFRLPFAAFWDGQRYLVESCQVELILSGGLLTMPQRTGEPLAPPLVISAPIGKAVAPARAETEMIQTLWPDSHCLIDDAKTLEYLQKMKVAPRLLHIAAHSILREDAPIFSALQLTAGTLSVEQCYDLNLRGTELVTLSGCTTATGLDTGGALLAFQSAFFAAGTKRVLSSLWPIEDGGATANWMGKFYNSLSAGDTPPQALRQTQLALLHEPAYSHPAIWAVFVCGRR